MSQPRKTFYFNRHQFYLFLLAVVSLLFLANRINRLVFDPIVDGVVVNTRPGIPGHAPSYGGGDIPVVAFQVDGRTEQFPARKERVGQYSGPIVPVIYPTSEPERAQVFTFWSFWLPMPTAVVLIATFLGILAYSIMGKGDRLRVRYARWWGPFKVRWLKPGEK